MRFASDPNKTVASSCVASLVNCGLVHQTLQAASAAASPQFTVAEHSELLIGVMGEAEQGSELQVGRDL